MPCGSRSSRVRSTSPTDGGTGTRSRCRSCAPTIQRVSSTTKNGLPPVRSCTWEASDRSPGEPELRGQQRGDVVGGQAAQPQEGGRLLAGHPAQAVADRDSGSTSPTVRAVTISSTGARGRWRASRPSSWTEVVSAPCRSSRTTSTGRSAAAFRRPRRSWNSRKRAASASSSEVSDTGVSSSWSSCSSTCVHGQSAGAPASSAQRLHATAQPAARPASAAASASRVLPMPASPSTTTTAAWPAVTCSAIVRSCVSSGPRPTSASEPGVKVAVGRGRARAWAAARGGAVARAASGPAGARPAPGRGAPGRGRCPAPRAAARCTGGTRRAPRPAGRPRRAR